LSRVAKQQAHGLTGYVPRTAEQVEKGYSRFSWGKGWTPEERVDALKRLSTDKKWGYDVKPFRGTGPGAQTLQEAREAGKAAKAAKEWQPPGGGEAAAEPTGLRGLYGRARAEMTAREASAGTEAARQGVTSMPGFLKGLATHPLQTLGTGAATMGAPGLAGMGALGVYSTNSAAKQAPAGHKGQAIGKSIGENAGWTLGMPVPVAGNIALGSVLGRAGGYLGAGVDRLAGGSK